MQERHLILEGGFNVRDLGGYPTEDGHQTRWKTLIRSGNLDKLSPAGQQTLIDYGVKTIIDLRDGWEVERYPNVFAQAASVTYRHLPLIGYTMADREAQKKLEGPDIEMHQFYTQYIAECQSRIGAIISAIADSDGCTVFHCYAGKDRTGIVAALILSVVGVSEDIIAEDYHISETNVTHLLERRRALALARGLDTARLDHIYAAKPQTILTLLRGITEQYGDVRHYLELCGVSQGQLERLRERFVD